jgi:hypothetical protein
LEVSAFESFLVFGVWILVFPLCLVCGVFSIVSASLNPPGAPFLEALPQAQLTSKI